MSKSFDVHLNSMLHVVCCNESYKLFFILFGIDIIYLYKWPKKIHCRNKQFLDLDGIIQFNEYVSPRANFIFPCYLCYVNEIFVEAHQVQPLNIKSSYRKLFLKSLSLYIKVVVSHVNTSWIRVCNRFHCGSQEKVKHKTDQNHSIVNSKQSGLKKIQKNEFVLK